MWFAFSNYFLSILQFSTQPRFEHETTQVENGHLSLAWRSLNPSSFWARINVLQDGEWSQPLAAKWQVQSLPFQEWHLREEAHTHRHSTQHLILIWELRGPKSVPVPSCTRAGASTEGTVSYSTQQRVSPRNVPGVGAADRQDGASLISFSVNCKCNFSCCILGKVQQQNYPPTVDLLKWCFKNEWKERKRNPMQNKTPLLIHFFNYTV